MKIVQVSDTHLSHLGGTMNDNFEHVVEFVNHVVKPDLVVNTGDVVLLFPDLDADFQLAAELHRLFDAPVRFIAGNHDVGMAGPSPWMGIAPTSERVARFRASFGSDRFLELVESDWALVGIDSEVLSTGLPEEAEQWEWLDEVARAVQGRSVVLFQHRAMWSSAPEPTEHPIAVEEADRERLLGVFDGSTLRAVGFGHLHRYLISTQQTEGRGDVLHVGSPSSAFIVKQGLDFGLNQVGIVEWVIEGDAIEAFYRSVPGTVDEEPMGMAAFIETMRLIEASAPA